MGFLDMFSRRGKGERKARLVPVMRGFEAAKIDRLSEGWHGDYGITAFDVMSQLPLIRNRCREMAKNDPEVCRALQMYRINLIGDQGIAFSADVLNGNGDVDMAASDKLEKAWTRWANNPEWCDSEGKKTLVEILWKAVTYWKREGEAIIEMVKTNDMSNPFHFCLALRRPDQLAVRKMGDNGKNKIYNGVEVNPFGKPVAYHFYETMYPNGDFGGNTRRVDADVILHLYEEEYEGQTRGFPVFAPVARAMRMASAYDEAELVAARVDAARVGTWVMTNPSDPNQVATEDDDGFHQDAEPGTARIAPYGWGWQNDSPSRPNAVYGNFKKAVLRRIASGLGLPYNVWANDLESVTYSSIRQGTQEDREGYKVEQRMIIEHLLRPMFRRHGAWLDCYLLSNKDGFSSVDADRLRECETWRPRRWSHIDPTSEMSALEKGISLGLVTRTDAAMEQGRDFYKNVDTRKQEIEWGADKGIDADGSSPKMQNATSPSNIEETTDEQN